MKGNTYEVFREAFLPDHDYATMAATFRNSGMDLAVAASRVVRSITEPPGLDGIHRLSLAIAEWYKTVANERLAKAGIKARVTVDGHDYMLVSEHYAAINEARSSEL